MRNLLASHSSAGHLSSQRASSNHKSSNLESRSRFLSLNNKTKVVAIEDVIIKIFALASLTFKESHSIRQHNCIVNGFMHFFSKKREFLETNLKEEEWLDKLEMILVRNHLHLTPKLHSKKKPGMTMTQPSSAPRGEMFRKASTG